jgi:hypothetical protein
VLVMGLGPIRIIFKHILPIPARPVQPAPVPGLMHNLVLNSGKL